MNIKTPDSEWATKQAATERIQSGRHPGLHQAQRRGRQRRGRQTEVRSSQWTSHNLQESDTVSGYNI